MKRMRAARGVWHSQVKSKGRGPLVLSGYVDGKPFYLYRDGTSPTPSKVGRAAAEAGGSSDVRKEACGTARQALEARAFGWECRSAAKYG